MTHSYFHRRTEICENFMCLAKTACVLEKRAFRSQPKSQSRRQKLAHNAVLMATSCDWQLVKLHQNNAVFSSPSTVAAHVIGDFSKR